MKSLDAQETGRLEKSVETGNLCAFYGGLLTSRQLEALRLHYEEDYTLGEIAEQLGVSRQNVHELITRSIQKLQRYEDALGLVARSKATTRKLHLVQGLIVKSAAAAENSDQRDRLEEASRMIETIIRQQEGEESEHGI